MLTGFVSIYLTGCLISALLATILHIIEYYEGVPKQLGELIIATILVIFTSWIFAVFASFLSGWLGIQ